MDWNTMIDWNTYSMRRKVDLQTFLSGISSAEDALNLFQKRKIANPPFEEINMMFAEVKVETPAEDASITNDTVDSVTPNLVSSSKKAKI